jgi:shikimate dehydrogenase
MRKYGLIGYPLTHSFSQRYFTDKFMNEGVADCAYVNFPIESISALRGLLSDPLLRGLNVTIPYKEQVLPFLDVEHDVVQKIRACNCIRIGEDGRLFGYNTDVVGFESSLRKKLAPHHRRALVLGTGGASKAVEYVLQKLGIGYEMVSRSAGTDKSPMADKTPILYQQVDADLVASHTLIINTTPLGMHPHTEECPSLPFEAITPHHYLFDLIYNPARTLFLRKGEERGAVVENGHDMLILQAEESWRIWNGGGLRGWAQIG